MTKPRAFLCYPGAASHIMTEAGFNAGAQQLVEPVGYAGTSAGGCIAIAGAFGVLPARLRGVLRELLQHDRVLDFNPFVSIGGALGLCSWNVVGDAVDELIGKGKRLGKSPLPLILGVTDLDSGLPRYFDSRNKAHKNILVRDIVRPMTAVPILAPQLTIPSWMVGTETPSIQLMTDGGVSDNTVDAVFDSEAAPRIAVRLVSTSMATSRVYHHTTVAQALALFKAMLTAASTIKSKRSDGLVLDVPAIGDGFDFSLTVEQADERWQAGYDAAKHHRTAIANLAQPRA